jgi:hypothetical protein
VEKPGNQAVSVSRVGEHANPPDSPKNRCLNTAIEAGAAHLTANPGGNVYLFNPQSFFIV